MTIFITSCPDCGEISVKDIDVKRYPEVYEFLCPQCWQVIRKTITPEVGRLLSKGGVPVTHVLKIPDEFKEEKSGPPITLDDLIDLALELRML